MLIIKKKIIPKFAIFVKKCFLFIYLFIYNVIVIDIIFLVITITIFTAPTLLYPLPMQKIAKFLYWSNHCIYMFCDVVAIVIVIIIMIACNRNCDCDWDRNCDHVILCLHEGAVETHYTTITILLHNICYYYVLNSCHSGKKNLNKLKI